jgi:hypothetical protein
MPALEPFGFSFNGIAFDTIPPGAFHFRDEADWHEFSKAFEEKFKEQFGDFYKTHEKDFEKMMKEFEENFSERFNAHEFEAAVLADEAYQSRMMAKFDQTPRAELWEDAVKESHHAQKELAEHQRDMQKSMRESMKHREEEMHVQEHDMREIEKKMVEEQTVFKKFQNELKELLVKDGYLQKTDEINNINWDDDGEIEVNNKKIKEEDRKKYNDLHDQYFKNEHH